MTDEPAQDAGNPSDSQEIDPSQLTDEELQAFFTGEEVVSEATPDEPEEDPLTETPEEETEVGNTTEETETEEERLAKMRVRPKDDKDQQILDLYKSEGWNKSLAEAADVINGVEPTTPAPATPTEGKPPEGEVKAEESKLTELQTEVAELEKEAKDAAEDLDTAKAFELQSQIMEKKMALLRLENEEQRKAEQLQASHYETYRRKAVESRDRAIQRYPVLADEDGVERKLFDQFIKERQADPDYVAVFDSPKWVELMANEFAQANNMQAPAPNPQDLNRPAKINPRVLTSGDTISNKSKGTITPDGIRDNMDRLDRDTLFKMLGA